MTPFQIGRHGVAPGRRETVDLPVSAFSKHTPVTLPVHVLHGERTGPAFFISGCVHGDEIQGVEIIRRILVHPALQDMAGTLLAVPIVNSFGFLNHTRYMPDRRDLNRCFPGSDRGSLASLVADLFFREVVSRCKLRRRSAHGGPAPDQPAADPDCARRCGAPGSCQCLRPAGDPRLEAAREVAAALGA